MEDEDEYDEDEYVNDYWSQLGLDSNWWGQNDSNDFEDESDVQDWWAENNNEIPDWRDLGYPDEVAIGDPGNMIGGGGGIGDPGTRVPGNNATNYKNMTQEERDYWDYEKFGGPYPGSEEVNTEVVDPGYKKSRTGNTRQGGGFPNVWGVGTVSNAFTGNDNDNNGGIIIPAINTNTPTSTTPTTTPQNTNMQKPGELKDFKYYLNQAKDTFTDEDFLNEILDSEKNLAPGFIDQRTDNINRSYEGYGGVATNAIGSVGDATTAANQRAREGGAQFFQDTYGKTIDSMRAGNRGLYDMVDSQSKQANMLGEKAMGLMENAGKLNERQRYGIEDGTRARMQQMGRGTSNFALEQELGNVIEAERLDANRDYATAGDMLSQQSNISNSVSNMEQPYMQQVFNQKVDPYAGLTLAESSKGLGQNVGPTMFDVGSLYGAAQGDYNQQSNLYLANKNAKAQKDSNFWNSAAGFGDMIGIDDYLERKLAEYNTPVEEEKG